MRWTIFDMKKVPNDSYKNLLLKTIQVLENL